MAQMTQKDYDKISHLTEQDFITIMRELWHGNYHGHTCTDKNSDTYIERTNQRLKNLEYRIKNILDGSDLEFVSIIKNPLNFDKSHIKVKCKNCGKTTVKTRIHEQQPPTIFIGGGGGRSGGFSGGFGGGGGFGGFGGGSFGGGGAGGRF